MPDLAYVSCPEFLKEGSAVDDFLHPDRVVIGADPDGEWAADAVEELYRPLGGEIVRTDVASAEMVKLASNAFLATKISFINEIANVSEEVGADVTEVARGMGLDQRIGPAFLQAGLGFGGSCFPKDTQALKQLAGNSGYHFQLLTSVIEVNELQKRRVMTQAREAPRLARGPHGRRSSASPSSRTPTTCARPRAWCSRPAYRARARPCADTTRWPSARARELLPDLELSSSVAEALRGADAAILVTEWPEFAELDWAALAHDDGDPAAGRRPQLPRPRDTARGGLHLRGHRPARLS